MRRSCFTAAFVAAALMAGTARPASMVIQGLTGDVTSTEISSFIAYMATQTPPTSDLGNNMADGQEGTDVEAMAAMYEITPNTTILQSMVQWCDTIMAYRNDQPLGEHRVMWDGRIEPVWPSKDITSVEAGYAACENADVAGHVARCAYLILSNPSVWNLTVPDHNPYHFGVTYKSRARTYIQMLDPPMLTYYTHWFVNPATDQFQTPTDTRWVNLAADETCTAWNRRMMFLNAYQYLAMCHDKLGDHPSFLPLYKAIVKSNADAFVAAAYPYVARQQPVYLWGYDGTATGNTFGGGEEVNGIHGEYDIWGIYRCSFSGYTNVTAAQMAQYSNTIQYVVYRSPGHWAMNVDGPYVGTQTYLYPGFIFMGLSNKTLFNEIAQDEINANKPATWPWMDASILWMKHWFYTHGQ